MAKGNPFAKADAKADAKMSKGALAADIKADKKMFGSFGKKGKAPPFKKGGKK